MDVVARASRQGIDLDGRGSVLLVRLLDRLRKDVLEADRRRRGPAGRGRQASQAKAPKERVRVSSTKIKLADQGISRGEPGLLSDQVESYPGE